MGKIALRLALLRPIVRPLGVFVHRQKADEVPLGAVNGHLTQGALGGTWASCAPQPLASGPKHGQGYLPQWCMSSGEVGVRSSACGSRLVGAMGHEPSETTRAGHLCDLPVCFSRAGAGPGLRRG